MLRESITAGIKGVSLRLAFAAAFAAAALEGCSGIEKAPPQSVSSRARNTVTLNPPEVMRGTVAAETILRGYQNQASPGYRPIIARGYGLVVGLKGTGSRNVLPQLREYMIQEAGKAGFGSERFGDRIASLTPEQLLNSPDTAVVIVEAIVPQGAPEGTRFDVRVYAEPSTDTSSLEGGTLYTTLLRPGPLAMGGRQAFELARAYGPVFVNPFSEPNAPGGDDILRTAGRVLNGGEVARDMPLKLQLINPSHARAAMLADAVNTRFPEEPGGRNKTARGESDELIEINVPPSWADRTEEFVKLLLHTTIAQARPEATAMYIRRTALANPATAAEPASYRWQALGPRVLPIIKDLYDHPDELPRLAALRAGARLDDGLVIPHLLQMAAAGAAINRLQAISLLQEMRSNPSIDMGLRALLDDDDVEVRLRAYEALVYRGDPFMQRFNVDGKFLLDVIKSDRPLIYVTQLGQPRIAVFGDGLEIARPLTLSAWSNRLMIKSDKSQPDLEVYYRDVAQETGVILKAQPTLPEFVRFLAHKSTIEEPEPGLNLTYGETVGALHQIWRQRFLTADFKLEQDRILAAIRRLQTEGVIEVEERPELSARSPSPQPAPATQSDLGRLDEVPVGAPEPSSAALPGTAPPRKPD